MADLKDLLDEMMDELDSEMDRDAAEDLYYSLTRGIEELRSIHQFLSGYKYWTSKVGFLCVVLEHLAMEEGMTLSEITPIIETVSKGVEKTHGPNKLGWPKEKKEAE